MNPSSGQPNPGQTFNQTPQLRNPDASVNGNVVGNLATNMNQNYVAPDIAPNNVPVMERLSNPEQQAGPKLGGQPIVQQPVVQIQQPVVVQTAASTSDEIPTTTAPLTAADNDKIEQEWVDAAKKVIDATRDDPYAQASAVADLMRDYVRKRYGKEVGKAPQD